MELQAHTVRSEPLSMGVQPRPVISSPGKRLRPQLGLIEIHCLGQTSFNLRQSCPLYSPIGLL